MSSSSSTSPWLREVPKNPFSSHRVWKLAASAGCGKTYTIERCINELLAQGVPPSEIMYVSYNTLPASQFRARFPHFTKDDMCWWATHHAIASRLLKKNSTTKFKSAMSGRHWAEFGAAYGYDFSEDQDDNSSRETRRLQSDVSRKLYQGIELDPLELQFLAHLHAYEQEHNVKSFDSMLFDALNLRLFPDHVRYVFVDEAQDNSRAQNEYWQDILNTHPIKGFMLVGDDKQAINGFKGGDAHAFLSFPSDVQVAFDTSYRCPPPVLELANSIAEPINPRSPLVERSGAEAIGEVIRVQRLSQAEDDIQADVRAKKSVLVLARSNRTVASIRAFLSSSSIPYHTETLERIRRIIRAFRDIKRTGYITQQEVDVLTPFTHPDDTRQDGELLLRCKYYDKEARTRYLASRKELSENQASFLALFEEKEDHKITPLSDAKTLGFTDAFITDILNGTPDPDCFKGSKEYAPVETVEEWMNLYGSDYATVRALTIHASKGLEADTVVLVTDLSEFSKEQENQNKDDERRVWYVASTRAKEKLIITSVSSSASTTSLL